MSMGSVNEIILSSWWGAFTSNLAANLLVAIIVGVLLVGYIERKKQKRLRKDQQTQVANLIWSELRLNRQQLDVLMLHVPKGNLVFPALETSVWEIIDKQALIDYFKFEDIHKIISIYARSITINRMYDLLLNNTDWPLKKEKAGIDIQFVEAFIYRCKELTTLMDSFADEIKSRRGIDIFD